MSNFEYLDSIINNNGDCTEEFTKRLAVVIQGLNRFKNLGRDTIKQIKVRILRVCIFHVAT